MSVPHSISSSQAHVRTVVQQQDTNTSDNSDHFSCDLLKHVHLTRHVTQSSSNCTA